MSAQILFTIQRSPSVRADVLNLIFVNQRVDVQCCAKRLYSAKLHYTDIGYGYNTNSGQAHNNSTCCTTNLPHRNARAQHLHMSRCWDAANFCPLVVNLLYNKLQNCCELVRRCPCSGVWHLAGAVAKYIGSPTSTPQSFCYNLSNIERLSKFFHLRTRYRSRYCKFTADCFSERILKICQYVISDESSFDSDVLQQCWAIPEIFSTILIEQKYRDTRYYRDTYHLVRTKFKTSSIWKACTAVTTTADIVYTESAERQLPTEQTRTNCQTTESRTGNRTSSPPSSSSPSSDRLPTHLSATEVYDFVQTVAPEYLYPIIFTYYLRYFHDSTGLIPVQSKCPFECNEITKIAY